MKIVKMHEYEGSKIFVVRHHFLFQYWFSYEGNMYMQWGVHRPKWYRFIFALVGQPLITESEMASIVTAYQEHAVRSIDHIQDPEATHCEHNVVMTGKNATTCAICSQEKTEDEKSNEK